MQNAMQFKICPNLAFFPCQICIPQISELIKKCFFPSLLLMNILLRPILMMRLILKLKLLLTRTAIHMLTFSSTLILCLPSLEMRWCWWNQSGTALQGTGHRYCTPGPTLLNPQVPASSKWVWPPPPHTGLPPLQPDLTISMFSSDLVTNHWP